MTLSVVIVNYNVKYFLRQCLASVFSSDLDLGGGEELRLDVWVVDNDSVDGSVAMVREEFPQVKVVANHENVGFARANNQALAQAAGDCLLLLNPDTVVGRDTLAQCALFMRSHADCGGLTVKMVDGHGRFLRESKRGFPTPQAAFYKISGLVRLFPHDRRIAAYYMGHLPDDEVGEIDIMCGAFLMVRRSVYEEIGGLDESYFMYGEDIDYSWRIKLAGWKNYYVPTTRIIHYKGESTRKGSMNYVYTFYNAMSIFVSRYFDGSGARFYRGLLKGAIWMRAGLAWASRIARRVAVPLADFLLAYAGFALMLPMWESLKGVPHGYYPPHYLAVAVPVYILVLMASSWLHGGYDKPIRLHRIVRGMGIGVLLLLAFYSLLDESRRYSRMLLLLGSGWTLAATLLVRLLLSVAGVKGYALRDRKRGSTLLVGQADETGRIARMMAAMRPGASTTATADTSPGHLRDLIRINHAEEVIFSSRDIPLSNIITLMAELRTTGVDYRIAPQGADYIIGSECILSPDEMCLYDLNTISSDTSRRQKRLFDIGTAAAMLLLSPVLVWFATSRKVYLRQTLRVLAGRLTWVGYTGHRGVFEPASATPGVDDSQRERMMLNYMRHYTPAADWRILTRCWRGIQE
ncbi:MAG: glycosyltransferase [Bacteroidales bacterium]|nr:glycosyltransferase [Bacteroidales bacterium]